MGLSTYGHDAPNTFKEGMNSEKALNLVMWKCNAWGGDKCKFDHLEFEDLETQGRRKLKALAGPGDACNVYADCHKCITA